MREKELDFTLAAGDPVYGREFDKTRHVITDYVVDPRNPIYCGWDFGYNGQAVAFFQQNNRGQIVWFDQIILKAVPLERVIAEVKARLNQWIGQGEIAVLGTDGKFRKSETLVLHSGDPSAKGHNTHGQTDIGTLMKYGIMLRPVQTVGRKIDLVDNVRAQLLPRSDGAPGLLVAKSNPDMEHVIAGFGGGYAFKKTREGKATEERPNKDGWYDHIFDACQYAIDCIQPVEMRDDIPLKPGQTEWWDVREPGVGTAGHGF